MSTPIAELLREAAEKIEKVHEVLVLTGAGISAESGIPTFRDTLVGLWENFSPEELASPEGFRANPQLVWQWYEQRREMIRKCQPNPAHFALVELAKRVKRLSIVTQNVDELHTRAGSKNVLELHGRILENRCFREGRILLPDEMDQSSIPPRCFCGSYARPGVVWFGEALPTDTLAAAFALAKSCDLCLIIGTSGLVQPAASLPGVALRAGAFLIEVNNQESALTDMAHLFLMGKAGEIVPRLVSELDSLFRDKLIN